MLVLDRPGADVKRNTYTVGFWTENRIPKKGKKWDKEPVLTMVNYIENETGYVFFANISDEFEESIESQAKILDLKS